jgi:NAD(P)H-dependent FMN reductase
MKNGPQSVLSVMIHTTIAVLVGSLRADSVNRKLAEALRDQAPEGVGIEIIDGLGEVPFYNQDVDNATDIPATAARLRERVASADRVLAVTPEYNGRMPAVLSNAIDWLSRPYGAGALVGKPFGVIGATPTPYGGKWAHADAVRSAGIAGATVVEDVTVSQSALEVDVLTDPEVQARLARAVQVLVEFDRETAAA